ncbi:MAG: glycosyltransferase family 2 protein [Elusimicrobia bacterium]|nr:glycosyltransferase family 2 protein [Elusimicrobiota bacterium]
MKLSIVSTLYRSASHLPEFYYRSSQAAQKLVGDDYEIVLVNDGSPDNSLEIAVSLAQKDKHIVVVDLSRNFGHHKAMRTGLEYSLGERMFLIDSDLEEQPEWLFTFSSTMMEESADVVFGVQLNRKGNWFERWSGYMYYSVFKWLCNIQHPRDIVTARLMSRRYVKAFLQFPEKEAPISCLWLLTGFKQCQQVVKKQMRSPSTYSVPKKIQLAMDSITSFSEVPLKIIFYLGASIFICALFYSAYLVFIRLAHSQAVDGWTSVMVSVWLLGGGGISFIGLLGIYISKIFLEAKQRPHAIVREIHGRSH